MYVHAVIREDPRGKQGSRAKLKQKRLGKGRVNDSGSSGKRLPGGGTLAHNGLAISECVGSRKAGKWFRERRSRGQNLKFMMRQRQEKLE